MTPKQKIKASKFLSLILRHNPDAIGIILDDGGWADVQDLIRGMNQHGHPITMTILQDIVAEDEKQRYAFSAHNREIRANQGHSIEVDLGLVSIEPPEYLFHGTARKTLPLIYRDGLKPMKRVFVHLSENKETARVRARTVGHGEPIVILIESALMAWNGFEFYRSANGVWLTAVVPVNFLKISLFDDCPRCGGDCGGANPPVIDCPMRD